jgi:hypothetical protein
MSGKDLVLAAALFPVWGIFAAILIATLEALEKRTSLKIPRLMYGGAISAGLGIAILVLLWLDCALFLDLPFANYWCGLIGF